MKRRWEFLTVRKISRFSEAATLHFLFLELGRGGFNAL